MIIMIIIFIIIITLGNLEAALGSLGATMKLTELKMEIVQHYRESIGLGKLPARDAGKSWGGGVYGPSWAVLATS